MVILGGLEVVAAGFLLNEFNKNKVEAREHRKHSHPHHDDRPRPRPPRPDSHGANHLAPPSHPPRPLSAPPPHEYGPKFGQRPPLYQQQPQNWGQRPQWQPGPQSQPPPPGPGSLQHPNTFNGPQRPPQQPFSQSSNSFPVQPQQQFRPNTAPGPPQQQAFRPQPQGNVYVDSKTGRVSHNLYPPDHPMARGTSQVDSGGPRELYGDEKYARSMAGDIGTGPMWSGKDDNDLAYGKDYSDRKRHRRDVSFEGNRDRRRSK